MSLKTSLTKAWIHRPKPHNQALGMPQWSVKHCFQLISFFSVDYVVCVAQVYFEKDSGSVQRSKCGINGPHVSIVRMAENCAIFTQASTLINLDVSVDPLKSHVRSDIMLASVRICGVAQQNLNK